MSTPASPNRWRRRMAELLDLIAAAQVEGDRSALQDQYEVARQNAVTEEAQAETARRLAADEGES